MVNTLEAIAESEGGSPAASYKLVPHIIERSEVIRSASSHPSILVLCSIVALVAALANAQELPASTSTAARLASGWWSPERAESGTAPQLLISMTKLLRFEAPGSFRTPPPQLTGHRPNEPNAGSIISLQELGSPLEATVAESSFLADHVSPPPDSFLSLLQTKYTAWESSLSDSRPLTDVNGVSVYPLLPVSYAGWHLPITLYISPLRGSDAR